MSDNLPSNGQDISDSAKVQRVKDKITKARTLTALMRIKNEIKQRTDLAPGDKNILNQAVEAAKGERKSQEEKDKEARQRYIDDYREANRSAEFKDEVNKLEEERLVYDNLYPTAESLISYQHKKVDLLKQLKQGLEKGEFNEEVLTELEKLKEQEKEQQKNLARILELGEKADEREKHHIQEINKIGKQQEGKEHHYNLKAAELKELKKLHGEFLKEARKVKKEVDVVKKEVEKNQKEAKKLTYEVDNIISEQPGIPENAKNRWQQMKLDPLSLESTPPNSKRNSVNEQREGDEGVSGGVSDQLKNIKDGLKKFAPKQEKINPNKPIKPSSTPATGKADPNKGKGRKGV